MLKLIFLLPILAYTSAIVCPPNYCDSVFCAPLRDCNGTVSRNGGLCGCCDTCLKELTCASAVVCPPDICSVVDCAAVESCNGRVSRGGGYCGCCDVCLTELMEGELCLDQFLMGVPPTSQCTAGTHCDIKTDRCVRTTATRDVGLCTAKLAEVEAKLLDAQQKGQPLYGLERPRCDADGSYAGMQYIGSQAYCVTKDGTAIDSYMVNRWETGPDMNCQCARDLYAYMKSGLIGKLFHCEPNGNYPPKTTATRDIGPCAAALARVDARLLDAQQHGSPLLGLERPHCDANGYYAGMQYSGSQAYCVTKNGTAISGYMVNRWETGPDMNCQCARDLYDYMQTGLIGKLFFCEPNGNYPKTKASRAVPTCQEQLAAVNIKLFAAEQSGHPLLGLEKPRCDSDGSYLGMQFSGSQAYCVTKDGTAIGGYMVNRWETGTDMNCLCARDQYAYMQKGLIGSMFRCEPNGNYMNVQCVGSVCYCADKFGKQVGNSTVSIGAMDTMNC